MRSQDLRAGAFTGAAVILPVVRRARRPSRRGCGPRRRASAKARQQQLQARAALGRGCGRGRSAVGGRRSPARSPAPDRLPPEARSRAASVRWKRSNTRSRSAAGIPAPSSSTTKRTQPPSSALRPRSRTSPLLGRGVVDRVADQVAQRLGETVAVGAAASPRGSGPSSKRRSASSVIPSHSSLHVGGQLDRLRAQEALGVVALGEQQQVVHQPADARHLGLHEGLHAAHLLRRRMLLGGQHLQLPADHRQRGAQLVRGVGDELPLARRRPR